MNKRAVLIVLDSVGVGELPDAARYGDEGSNTLSHVLKEGEGFALPNMAELGLGCIEGVQGLPCPGQPGGGYGRMAEKSKGKDTTTGHWELAGLHLPQVRGPGHSAGGSAPARPCVPPDCPAGRRAGAQRPHGGHGGSVPPCGADRVRPVL